MPSPRKGGTVPIRRRRKHRAGASPRAAGSTGSPSPSAPPAATAITPSGQGQALLSPRSRWRFTSVHSMDSDSSWVDTTDTSIVSSDGASPGSSRSPSYGSRHSSSASSATTSSSSSEDSSTETETGSSSVGSSGSEGDTSSSEDDDEEDEDSAADRRRARMNGVGRLLLEKRGRSWSRRGARERGGSVLCRYCGKRGYGVMKMVLSCCRKMAAMGLDDSVSSTPERDTRDPAGLGPRESDRLLLPAPATLTASRSVPSSPCPRYKWSPCSSDSSSSSSTLSEDAADGGISSSGEDADVECKVVPVPIPPLQLLHGCRHVAVS